LIAKLRAARHARADEDRDRGAVLVEFALIMPFLTMLLFAILSAGLAWNQILAMSHGARLAGRYAATLPTRDFASLDDWLDAVATRVVSSSEGNLDSTVPGKILCVAYVHPSGVDTLDHTRRRMDTAGVVTRADSTCFSDSQANTETRIQVMSERTGSFEVGLWSRAITIHQQIVYRYEVTSGL
jgi:hypothetical protein